jgi:hypothetical protein
MTKSTVNFQVTDFFEGGEWKLNKFVPDVLEPGLT